MPRWLLAGFVMSTMAVAQDEELPRCLDDRLKIELFAEHPDIVTPTGIDVDHLGRVFVIESNTHFPPDEYQGHPTDRVLILENADDDPQADKFTVFADGLVHTMSVAVEPVWLRSQETTDKSQEPGEKADSSSAGSGLSTLDSRLNVFLATRNEIFLLTDTDGDSKADEQKRLVHLETAGNYPHNGLAGFAFDAFGNMFFGFGENLGADYKIIGSDGTTLSGGGEGGNLYRCQPDGSKLERWATGFWNPHASCFDAFGRLFTVDNDADSRPPCRLLHIIPGGDYGYRFRNGRKGTHPFTSWNGELPGTLPMVAGTGEAPSGIVCYENDGFPEDYLGTLLVGSWGDHRIDQFVLEPKGASFTSKAKPIVQGGENFRPVGLAVAPDGSLYVSDWVLKDYKLHGRGRVWRVSGKKGQPRHGGGAPTVLLDVPGEAIALEVSVNLIERRVAARRLAAQPEHRHLLKTALGNPRFRPRTRIEALWAIASIPKEIEDMQIRPAEPENAPIAIACDEVATSLVSLINRNDQFQMDIDELSSNTGLTWFQSPNAELISPSDVTRFLTMAEVYLGVVGMLALSDDLSIHDTVPAGCCPSLTDPLSFVAGIHDIIRQVESAHEIMDDMRLFRPVDNFTNELESWRQTQYLLAARLRDPQFRQMAEYGLKSEFPQMRFAAVQWIGEEDLSDLRPDVEALLADPATTPDLFLACLATLQLLDGKPASEFEKQPPTQYIAALLNNPQSSPAVRATALRMLPANAPELDAPLLRELLSSNDETLRIEAVRTLASSPLPEARGILLPIAANPQASITLRAEAIGGLCHGPHEVPLPQEIETLLLSYARGKIPVERDDGAKRDAAVKTLQLEALRSLRGRSAREPRIRETIKKVDGDAELKEAVGIALQGKPRMLSADEAPRLPTAALGGGNARAGRRVFFHHNGPLCAHCHMVQGRGGQIGPDLTVIARTMNRDKLLASILEPSKEIAPQFTTWIIETTSGKTHTGFILEDNRTGQIKLGTAAGEVLLIDEAEIETREPSKLSVMPEKLHEQMTSQELRDLLAFLESLK